MTSREQPRQADLPRPNPRTPRSKHPILRNLRILADIVRDTGLARITCVFVVLFLVCSTIVWLADREHLTLGDGMWFSYEAVSTIGFGDISADGPVARITTVVLSVFSIFYIALLTGVVVSYCTTLAKARQNDELATFMEDLEHLEDKTPTELAALSKRVREFRARR